MVSIDWLLDSNKEKKPVSELAYRFGATNGHQTATDGAFAQPEKKRTAKAVQDADVDDPNKKLKSVEDAQRVTSDKMSKMKVGVDELYYPNDPAWSCK